MKWFFVFLSLLVIGSLAAQEVQEENPLDWNIDSIFDTPIADEPAESFSEAAEYTEIPAADLTGQPAYSFSTTGNSLDWDIDSIFDTPIAEEPDGLTEVEALSMVRRQGFTFDGTFEFLLGLSPGWDVAPWTWFPPDAVDRDRGFSWVPGVRMRVRFDLNTQISEVFRVISSIYFTIPGFSLALGDFFFDYALYNTVFFRAGKYNHAWGISPNYAFTNLLARIPNVDYERDPFIFKADIPIGLGGIQLLALTRVNLMDGDTPGPHDIAYGAKFNLALRWADFDLGAFYQEGMPLRGFFSVKTTLGNTELYNEYLGVMDVYHPEDKSGAVNLGFIRDFFNGKFTVNGEVFYNAEKNNTLWYQPETSIKEADSYMFIDGFNLAWNMIYRFRGKGNVRLFLQSFYAPQHETAHLVPGFRLSPFTHLEFYVAVPMALGSRNGYYYTNTANPLTPHRPFSVVILFTLNGSVKIGQFN